MESRISSFTPSNFHDFKEMLSTCFRDDYKIELTHQQLELLAVEIVDRVYAGITDLGILFVDDAPCGFILYQIDNPKSDWCERVGWGFIRELYVDDGHKGQGYGKELVSYAEQWFEVMSTPNIYLTSDDAGDFWESLGYKPTGELSKNNSLPVYVKK